MSVASHTFFEPTARATDDDFKSPGVRVATFDYATIYSKVSAFVAGTADLVIEVADEDVDASYSPLKLASGGGVQDVACDQQVADGVESITIPVAFKFMRVVLTTGTSADLTHEATADFRRPST